MSKIWFTDGGGWSGKTTSICVVNTEGYNYVEHYKDHFTNNETEYKSLIHCLKVCEIGAEIKMDSKLVVEQVNGRWQVRKPHLFPLWKEARKLFKEKKIVLTWVSRDDNLAGHVLEKQLKSGER